MWRIWSSSRALVTEINLKALTHLAHSIRPTPTSLYHASSKRSVIQMRFNSMWILTVNGLCAFRGASCFAGPATGCCRTKVSHLGPLHAYSRWNLLGMCTRTCLYAGQVRDNYGHFTTWYRQLRPLQRNLTPWECQKHVDAQRATKWVDTRQCVGCGRIEAWSPC